MSVIASPITEAQGAHLKDFKHRTAIIKADDLGKEPALDCWWRLLDALDRRGVPISAGVVAGRIRRHSSAALDRLTLQLREGCHEIWNHSYSHLDYAKLSLEDQAEDLRRSQLIIEEIFAARPYLFGAPFNSMNEATIQALEANGDFTGVYFSRLPTLLETVSYWNLCPPEFVGGFYRQPDFVEFLPRYERRKDRRPMVLQIHPPAWSQHGLNDFIRIVDWLIEKDWQFITFDDYAQYHRREKHKDAPLTSSRAELVMSDEHMSHALAAAASTLDPENVYNIDRFANGTLHLRNFLRSAGFETEGRHPSGAGPVGLDIGCGAGNWSVAYAALSPRHRVVGIDTDQRLVATIGAAARALPAGERMSFMAGSILEIPAKDCTFDHAICNNLLNYVPLDEALAEIRRVLKPGGTALVGVQNRNFWLKGFFDGLREGNLPAALRRIDQLGYQAARGAGLPPVANYASIWDEDPLSQVAESLGLDRTSLILADAERSGQFLGTSLFSHYLLERPRPVADPSSQDAAGSDNAPELAGQTNLFVAGAWQLFLDTIAKIGARDGGSIEDNRIQRMVTASVALASINGVEIAAPCAAVANRHRALREALTAFAEKDYARAADELVKIAPDYGRDLAGAVAMALYAAGKHGAALHFSSRSFGPQAGWNDHEWMVWLTVLTAAEGLEAAKQSLAAYFEWRLDQIARRLPTADLAVMMQGEGLKAAVNTDELTVASLRVAISALRETLPAVEDKGLIKPVA